MIAKKRLAELLHEGKSTLSVVIKKMNRVKDQYARTLAIFYVEGGDVGKVLVNDDVARPWRRKREFCNK